MSKHSRRIRNDTVALLKFERSIADLTMQAYRDYTPIVLDAALPSLTAGVTDPLPPDINNIMLTQAQWDAILDGTFMPGIEQLTAQRIADRLEEEGIDLEEYQKAVSFGAPVTPVTPAVGAAVLTEKLYNVPTVREWQVQYLSDVRNRMVNTPTTVFRDIAKDLNKGIAKGEGIAVLRDRVQQFLDLEGMQDWKGRAETVARTEATGAFNGAGQAASQARQEVFGIVLEKVWVSTMDSRTRKTHFAADGQRRPLNARFRVGKSDLRWPGDPRGRAEEVINCRCTTIELEPDEELPDETDRQTERADTNATVRNRVGQRVGDIQGEVDRRAAEEGVVRARDDDGGDGLVAAGGPNEKESTVKRTWKGTLAPLGVPTGDGRIIKADAKIGFREFPHPLSWQKVSADGHLQSVIVGGILAAEVDGEKITGSGFMLETPEALEAIALLEEGLVRPSLDPSDVVWEMVDEDGNPVTYEQLENAWMAGEDIKVLDQFAEMTVMGATLVDHPAFAEAIITLDPEDAEAVDEDGNPVPAEVPTDDEVTEGEAALLASVATIKATNRGYYVDDPTVFDDPKFTEPTGLHITDDGRVQGHLALWGSCHLSVGNVCRQPPHSVQGYSLFHTSEVGTPEGPLAVGKLTVGGGHADERAGMQPAMAHYDNSCSAFSLVRVGEDEHGIWASGIAHPRASNETLSDGLSSPMSGDWRRVGGNLELIAALAVNNPGFPVPRGYRNDEGQDYSLVASGAVPPRPKPKGETVAQMVERAAALAVDQFVSRQDRVRRVDALAAKITERRAARVADLAARLRSVN